VAFPGRDGILDAVECGSGTERNDLLAGVICPSDDFGASSESLSGSTFLLGLHVWSSSLTACDSIPLTKSESAPLALSDGFAAAGAGCVATTVGLTAARNARTMSTHVGNRSSGFFDNAREMTARSAAGSDDTSGVPCKC